MEKSPWLAIPGILISQTLLKFWATSLVSKETLNGNFVFKPTV